MSKKSPLIPIASFLILLSVTSFAQDAAPIDTSVILRELTQLQEQQRAFLTQNRQQLIRNCTEASKTPERAMDAYLQAVMAMNFAGANRENTKFKEWRDKEKPKWDKDFEGGLQFYFYYMSISLRRAGNEPDDILLPQLAAYCRDFQAAPRALKQSEWMKKSLGSTVIANWLQVTPLLPKSEDWELTPGDVDSICEKSLLPWWREKKNPAVIEYWDQKIALEAAAADESNLESAAGKFTTQRKPSLLWHKAEEYFGLGQPNRGITEMFAVIKQNPAHPQFNTWVAALKEKLSPAQSQAATPQ